MSKPLVLYSHVQGPNPWKCAIILEELGLKYETHFMEMPDLKKEPFTNTLNPNGRVPALVDPNTDITLWESGAIVEYLCDTYDLGHKLSYGNSSPEKYQIKQWLYFQVSGQGPYFGQKAWFTHFHSDKNIKSAIERYGNEVKRVVGVLDKHLEKIGTGWLVGDKCTYADLAFVPWDMMIPFIMGEEGKEVFSSAPHFARWHEAMMARPAVKRIADEKNKLSGRS